MNIQKIQTVFQHYQAGDLEQARKLCREILKKQPKNADILYFLGVICYQLQNYDSAIQYIGKALRIKPTISDAYYNLGRAFQKKGEANEAIMYYQKSIQSNPHLIDAYLNIGNLFQENGRIDEAIINYQKAIELNPNFAGAYYNLGVVLQEKGQLNEAVSAYQKAIHFNPFYADAYHDLGYVFQTKGEIAEAIRCYQKALDINPNLFDAHNNLGRVFQEKGQLSEAIVSYQKTLQINPNFAEAHCNLAMAFLLSGNFEQGWKEYEWRWKLKDRSRYDFPQPLWDGSDISGRTIFLYAEQGFGDTIQFIRYVPLVSERKARVILECQKEIIALLQNVKGIEHVITREDKLPEFDVHCPLLSLPMVFNTNLRSIPSYVPYITIEQTLVKKWKERISGDGSRVKVGLVWSGNPRYKADQHRSCNLEVFSPFAGIKGITFYSLQKGEASGQINNPPEWFKIIDLMDEVQDFSDTAGLIANLDLVISVDTSVAHLAGAIGKPIWVLLPFSPDWRWLLNRDDSPWYPTMRLFRQPSPGDWTSVVKRICIELKKITVLPNV